VGFRPRYTLQYFWVCNEDKDENLSSIVEYGKMSEFYFQNKMDMPYTNVSRGRARDRKRGSHSFTLWHTSKSGEFEVVIRN